MLDFNFMSLVVIFFQIYLFLTVVYLLLDNREPAETFAWIFIFILMPGVGVLIYFIAGHNGRRRYNRRDKLPQVLAKNLEPLFADLQSDQERIIASVEDPHQTYRDDLMMLLYRNSRALITLNNRAEIFHDGRSQFEALIADLESARHFIHMEYFIWHSGPDPLALKIQEILVRKAREGVEVRILYDFYGCFFKMSRAYRKKLQEAGVRIYPFFNYLSSLRFHTVNHRNHRKISIIDGRAAYVGGMNIGQEYIDGGDRYPFWRDTHIRFEGEAVRQLQAVYAIDWFNTTHESVCFEPRYYAHLQECRSAPERGLAVQFPTSGYDTAWPALLHLYFAMITMAQKKISIVSPYFVPEASLLTALKTAAMRGLEVTVLMTGRPDNPLPFWAAYSYFEELLRAGVQIYQYQKGFMHAKMISIDGTVCSIGTTNFDNRSLKLNYEVNAVFYDEATARALERQIARDLEDSRQVHLEDAEKIGMPVKLRNSMARLLSSIL